MTNFEQQVRTVVDLFSRCCTEAANKAELTEIITANVKKLKMLEEYVTELKLTDDLVVVEDATKVLANDIAEAKMILSEVFFLIKIYIL